jgi:5-methyltetrahydrofolate--homocysteine methyltransferase
MVPHPTQVGADCRRARQAKLTKESAVMSLMEEMGENLIKGKAKDVAALVQQAVDEGVAPEKILNEGLLPAMNTVGVRFKNNEVYVPEVLIAARAMKSGTEILRPLLAAAGIAPKGRVVIGTVKGDLHDIGKNLLCMMVEGAGLKVIDAGIDVEPRKFVELAKEHDAQLIGVSALLTTTMTNMKAVVEEVKKENLVGAVKVMVGGAPVTQAFCDEIGADGYAPDAASGAELAKKLIGID